MEKSQREALALLWSGGLVGEAKAGPVPQEQGDYVSCRRQTTTIIQGEYVKRRQGLVRVCLEVKADTLYP